MTGSPAKCFLKLKTIWQSKSLVAGSGFAKDSNNPLDDHDGEYSSGLGIREDINKCHASWEFYIGEMEKEH